MAPRATRKRKQGPSNDEHVPHNKIAKRSPATAGNFTMVLRSRKRKLSFNSEDQGSPSKIQKCPSETTIESLVDDTLILVFERMNILDRLVAEKVCRRWNSIVKRRCWTDLSRFSYKVFDELRQDRKFMNSPIAKRFFDTHLWKKFFNGTRAYDDIYAFSISEFASLLSRFGPYLQELDLDHLFIKYDYKKSSESLMQSIRLASSNPACFLPKLQRITVGGTFIKAELSSPKHLAALRDLAITLPHLKSATFLENIPPKSLISFVNSSQSLQSLRITSCNSMTNSEAKTIKFPASLKGIQLGTWSTPNVWLNQIIVQKIELSSLQLLLCGNENLWVNDAFKSVTSMESLLFLSITMRGINPEISALQMLRNLKAVEFSFDTGVYKSLLEEITESIPQIEHFGLRLGLTGIRGIDEMTTKFAKLPNLKSLSVVLHNYHISDINSVNRREQKFLEEFFGSIIKKGNLQYFHTSLSLSNDFVTNIVTNCPALKLFSWSPRRYTAKVVHDALDEIHGSNLPSSEEDDGILAVKLRPGQGNRAQNQHPWLRYLETLPSSPILQNLGL
ncbi:F-box domain containing protein [Ditylenchus destructor]|uniref:F-box domain containing protein n=1 Tax=Ditylenchus destructor TaxID=166010 RepID=A0AAD4QUF1_9BILA|nr:F-box domain containing protein [Ditylenchus destructor]